MLMNIGPGHVEREGWRELLEERTEGGRMEEDNGFYPNKCTA